MDFFEHQERAQKSTENLLVLFALAVAAIVGTVYFVLVVTLQVTVDVPFSLWQPRAFLWTTIGVVVLITLGSLWKNHQLRGGGAVVARRLGGRRIDLDTPDPLERRALNVVQEMAIASGTPVPDVYLLDGESGINAFAAGHTPADAVIGVTRGTIEKLSREELQGVMGHEFSHLLNGDMRLNLRLMAVVHGILVIALVGRGLMYGGRGGRRRDGGSQAALVGLALFLIGYVGVFFGNLIKAAVSRQREFLADASAVQFTRNPRGIAGALLKIGGLPIGSRMGAARADEASHMFFGDSRLHRITSAMATHPPLAERIRRIDPSFVGRFPAVAESYVAAPAEDGAAMAAPAGAAALAGTASDGIVTRAGPGVAAGAAVPDAIGALGGENADRATMGLSGSAGERALDRIGRPGPEHLERARALWESVPEPLREAAHVAERAVALAYALLIAPSGTERDRQLAVVLRDDPGAAPAVDALLPAAAALQPDARLPLLEVAAAALATMDSERFATFGWTVRDLVEGDREVELSEWMISRLLLRQVRERVEPPRPTKPRYRSIGAFAEEATVLLSALAHAGHGDEAGAGEAFAAAAREVGLPASALRAPDACPPRALEAALETFALLVPGEKRRLISACAASVSADQRVLPREAELFRVVSDWLGAPVPPLLPGQLLN